MSQLLKRAEQLLAAGEFAAAEELCRQVLAAPGPAGAARKLLGECLYNQGVLLMYSGMHTEAEERFGEALQANPKHVLALNNLGSFAESAGLFDKAIALYKEALAADPRSVICLRNLATCYQRTDRIEEAAPLFDRLARLDPGNTGLYMLRNATLIKAIIPDRFYPEQVRERMHAMLGKCLETRSRSSHPEKLASPYFYLSYHGKSNRELHSRIAQAYLHVCPSLGWEAPHIRHEHNASNRIRIGIVSAHMYNHSIGHTTRGLVEHLDKAQFHVTVIRLGSHPQDEIATAIDQAADAVIKVGTSDLQQSREQIAALELDLLFYQDIGMEPFSYLLSFSRLARVQVTSFGHPDTTGIPNMDYFISSELYEPENAQDDYSEKLVLIPNAGTLSYYYRPLPPAEAMLRSEFGLDESDHIYFCPQTLFKIHPDMDAVFAGIVQRDAQARIVLIEPKDAFFRQALEKRFQTMPHAASERIQFIKRMPHAAYLRLMSCADVMLDTIHFNGQNTNLEAFSIGIPVVTWPGTMQRARHTLGMYKKMGEDLFADLIAESADDYADKAVKVASDQAHRETLQARIASRRSMLYEDIEFVRSCERLFRQMLQAPAKPAN
ncbi:tetratricopeptide repeat protein [Noviherbaspirillum massiliense]|uniref:O-linked N-acetylglucosamine transferase, SPINDLY family protein n=1 Tax=Noviherbaspirillum massiliense TaxID=1465823 RepID=UPI0009D99320|nr:tetratricopeptide repeat protein [Noviherbaspirillum massiliense]